MARSTSRMIRGLSSGFVEKLPSKPTFTSLRSYAPLDNNLCERALKRAILNQKNSLFYKSQFGAYIGDMFMSIIHACGLMKVNSYNYLVALQKYSSRVFRNPESWMPWNYEQTIASLAG